MKLISKITLAVALAAAQGMTSIAWADDICPKRGGVLKTVDMHYVRVDPTQRSNPVYQMRLVYDSLLDINHDLSLAPGLAEAMPEQIDDTTFVFKLRKGVTFHDGSEFNADAVKFNVDSID